MAFLLGTLVSMGLTANGMMPNPFENHVSEIQIIRFTKSDEINITNYNAADWYARTKTASYLWSPTNPQSNLILSIYCHFEIRCGEWTWIGDSMRFNTIIHIDGYQSGYEMVLSKEDMTNWTLVVFKVNEFSAHEEPSLTPTWIRPNQENYNLTLAMGGWGDVFYTPTYVRNINIIMEVIDG